MNFVCAQVRSKPVHKKGSNLGNIGSVADSTVSGVVGSLMYMAPEVVRGTKYDEKVSSFFHYFSGWQVGHEILL